MFGAQLKEWRERRRLSQLDLGLAANVSARHVSFLETGRARPSREMVLQLAETLEVPRAERNRLLNAAGFAPRYRSRTLEDADMAAVREAVEWTLARHDPYPGFAVDRHWRLVRMNRCAQLLFGGLGLTVGESLLEAMARSDAVRAAVENWAEVARWAALRLRTESAHLGGDPVLDAAAERLLAEVGPAEEPDGEPPAVIPARYRVGETTLSFFSTIAQFGSAEDIALADLRIELLFPADAQTKAMLTAMASG